ncbi:MAG: C45 family autoproteolytic acyltransferase/hydrolase [Candidatus Bipolaricaulia bacterium]
MLPLIELEGTLLQQGRTHGRQARARIEHNLEVYFDRFQGEGRLARDEVLRRATAYWQVIQDQNSDYAEALQGVSEGSGCDLIELVALNVRYEILYHQFTANALADGCTAFAVLPEMTEDGHLILGQNWDWIPQVQGVVLHVREEDFEVLCFTEAGIVGGKIGLNSWGLGLAVNGLISTDDDWSRLKVPFHVRCFEILRARDLNEAVKIITDSTRACSANHLIAQLDDRVVDVEAAPRSTCALTPEDGFTVHTNHFLDPEVLDVVEPPNDKRPYSLHRLHRYRQLLASKRSLTVSDLKAYLRDHEGHPQSVCRHIDKDAPPQEWYRTVTSVVMDLHALTLWISDGPPCENTYQELNLTARDDSL